MARIVVADDDVDIRELVEFKLTTMGHEIVAVGDGGAALAACRARKPDLAVLEIMGSNLRTQESIRLGESEGKSFYEIIEASYTFGWWDNEARRATESYLRDARGAPIESRH